MVLNVFPLRSPGRRIQEKQVFVLLGGGYRKNRSSFSWEEDTGKTGNLFKRRVKPGNVPKAYGCNVSRRFSFFAFTWREERKKREIYICPTTQETEKSFNLIPPIGERRKNVLKPYAHNTLRAFSFLGFTSVCVAWLGAGMCLW